MRINARRLESLPPNLKVEAEAALQLVKKGVEVNPLIAWAPHSKQNPFLAANERLKAMLGGNRSGKTEVGTVDDLVQACDWEHLPEHLHRFKFHEGPFYCRAVCPDLLATLQGVILPKFRRLSPRAALKGGSFDDAYNKAERILNFQNGSWIQFMTYEMDVDKFGGAALHRVHFDEEPPEDIYRECMARLIDYGGQALLTLTPLKGLTFLYDEVWEQQDKPGIKIVTVDMDDNPHLDEEAKRVFLSSLPEAELEARKHGRFVHIAGLVYKDFSDEHIVELPPLQKDRQQRIEAQSVLVGIDPGIRRTGVVFAAFDDDNSALVFDEIYVQGWTIEQVSNLIRAKENYWGVSPDQHVIDPSARNRTQVNAENIEGEFARYGIFCAHGQNEVQAGVLHTQRRLHRNMLAIASTCPNLIREFRRYRFDPKAEPEEFKVLKRDDHLVDALRYTLMQRAWGVDEPYPDVPEVGWTPGKALTTYEMYRLRAMRPEQSSSMGSLV